TMLILLISSVYITLIFFSIVLINTNIWEQFISFLGETTDLTGRTDIWKMSLELFQNHIFFGNGKGLKFYLDTIWSNNYYVEECHNVLVEVITTSGVFGTVFFLDY